MKCKAFFLTAILLVIFTTLRFGADGNDSGPVFLEEDHYKTFYKIAGSPLTDLSKPAAWRKAAPEVSSISINSSADGSEQPALFYNSGSDRKKPLLVVLHSWSADYQQHFSIPYGVWSIQNDWVFIHPNYRGPYNNPESTASEVAIRDVLDALEYAKGHAEVDETRIYLTGFSGGGMTTLILVGRYPNLWTAAAAWVPVYDLVKWYATTKGSRHDYSEDIESSCGGPPHPGTEAERECLTRSPVTYLKNAAGKEVQVYIATGIKDNFVPINHSILAFNDLAEEKDRISEEDMDYMVERKRLPPHLSGSYHDPLFSDAGIDLLFERKSANATLKIFNSRHDVIYNAGLHWLSTQKR